jgi:hypothetical protein
VEGSLECVSFKVEFKGRVGVKLDLVKDYHTINREEYAGFTPSVLHIDAYAMDIRLDYPHLPGRPDESFRQNWKRFNICKGGP